MGVHRPSSMSDETGTLSVAGGDSGTEQVPFANEYAAASATIGLDGGATLLGTVQATWKNWVRNNAGNITGMRVVYSNDDTTSHQINWNITGEVP